MAREPLYKHIIMYGLPGCGKTTEANHIAYMLDFECELMSDEHYPNLKTALEYWNDGCNREITIWDFPITTYDELIPLIKQLSGEISIIYFPEDRFLSLERDKKRGREISAEITIKNKPYEKLDINVLREIKGGIELINGDVEYTNKEYDAFKKRHGLGDTMESESWSGGGTWRNCWGDENSIGSGTPLDKTEVYKLKEVIEKECPNSGWVTAMKVIDVIHSECEEECDYYGGSETKYRWVLNTRDLFDILVLVK